MAKGEQKLQGAHAHDTDERLGVPTTSQGIKGASTDNMQRPISTMDGDYTKHLSLPPSIQSKLERAACVAQLTSEGLKVTGENADDVEAVSSSLVKIMGPIRGPKSHLESAKSLFFLIIGGVFILGLAFVIAGIVLVSLGATGKSRVAFFGLDMTSANVGIISIAFGAAVIVIIVRNAMKHIQAILALAA